MSKAKKEHYVNNKEFLEAMTVYKKEVKKALKAKKDKVICALSGGVDSSVVALLINKAINKNLICIMV